MRRRQFLQALAGGFVLAPLAAQAQAPSTARVGFFYFGSRRSALSTGRYAAFREGMRELGYVEGRNLLVEARFGDSKPERLPALAAELVSLKVDVIVATGSPTYRVLRRLPTVPVVVTVTFDPVTEGLAATMARPGGNFTGLSDSAADLGPKQLELLKAVLPGLSRMGVLRNPDNGSHAARMERLMRAAHEVGVQVVPAEAATARGIEVAFASLAREHTEAVLLFDDTFFVQQFPQIAQAALNQRAPSIGVSREYPEAGGLMSYGPELLDNFRRAALYVDKILRGARPGQLPFEQPARFYLVINLKTARALGLTVPRSLRSRADHVIG